MLWRRGWPGWREKGTTRPGSVHCPTLSWQGTVRECGRCDDMHICPDRGLPRRQWGQLGHLWHVRQMLGGR